MYPLSRSVWERLKALVPTACHAVGTEGDTLRQITESLLTFFEVVSYGVLLLLLPSVVVDLFFGCTVTDILVQAMLVALAGTGILTAFAVHQGWYLEHLSGWGIAGDRVEPSLGPPSAPGEDGDKARLG